MRLSNAVKRVGVDLYWLGVLFVGTILSLLMFAIVIGLTILAVSVLAEVFLR